MGFAVCGWHVVLHKVPTLPKCCCITGSNRIQETIVWQCGSNSSTQANSALSMMEQEGFEAQLAAARRSAESAQASAAAVRAHYAHKCHALTSVYM